MSNTLRTIATQKTSTRMHKQAIGAGLLLAAPLVLFAVDPGTVILIVAVSIVRAIQRGGK